MSLISSDWMIHKYIFQQFGKVGCAVPMVISSDFHMDQHRDDDHQEDAPHFSCSLIAQILVADIERWRYLVFRFLSNFTYAIDAFFCWILLVG